jgi:hypothetical protein
MKRIILLRSITLMLAFLIMSGSAGITLNAHYCNTNQTLKRSFLPFPIECSHESDSCIPQSEGDSSCCHTAKKPAVSSEKNCCDDFIQHVKGLSEFELPKIQIKSLFNKFLTLVVRVLDIIFPTSDKAEPTASSSFTGDDPPPVSGKMMTIFFRQLKLADPLG